MRIRTLSFTGVGPYRDPQHIDFDQLHGTGLYLINGPTGAGKSTIIDAIVYALYGRLSGDDSDDSRLRSDFSASDQKTEVELVFETADGVFKVIRTPRYLREKRNREGFTDEKATCKLFRIHTDGSEEAITTNIGSANSELQTRLGLTAEQFLQTVVLPQGQFATFLRAKTKERADILKRIFGTRLYERIAELLKDQAKTVRESTDQATTAIREAVLALHALVPLDEDVKQLVLDQVRDGLDASLQATLGTIEPALRNETELRMAAAKASDEIAVTADKSRTNAKAEADATAVLSQAAAAVSLTELESTSARMPVEAASDLATSLNIAIDESNDEQIWRARSAVAATEAGALQSAIEAELAVSAWPKRCAEIESRIAVITETAARENARFQLLPTLIATQAAVAAARPTQELTRDLLERKQAIGAEFEVFAKLEIQRTRRIFLDEAVASAYAKATSSNEQFAVASRAFIDGLASTLALELRDHEPCPVCGSTEHPAKATTDGTLITKEQVDGFSASAAAARDALVKAEEAVRTSEALVLELASQLRHSREELEALQASWTTDEHTLNASTAAAALAESTATELRNEQQTLTLAATDRAAELAAAKTELKAAVELHAGNVEKALAGRAGFATVAARQQAISALQEQLGQLAAALGKHMTAVSNHVKAEQQFNALAQHPTFGDVASAEAAWVAARDEKSIADMAALQSTQRLQAFAAAVASITALCEARQALVADSADLVHLADLFKESKGTASGLHIYVLQSLFAKVVEAANMRFQTLLGGRFELVSTSEEDGDGRSVLGLGLSVRDGLTGKTRPATSLSGGETFCASLALALGLADVVRMGAGGIEIGSLFIDEGFGSLDPRPLEDVMTMLHQLGSNGRLVGLISHVPDMKTAIPEKITVVPAGEDRPTKLEVSWMS